MADFLLVLIILTNIWLLGASRLTTCIHACARQGILLGALALTVAWLHGLTLVLTLVALTGLVVKGFIIPWLLLRAVREIKIAREIEPLVGYNLSLAFGLLTLGASLALARRVPLPTPPPSELLVPVAFSTLAAGLFLVVARKKALTQALGYLVFENGIFAFGLAVLPEAPVAIELGILLDALVAVLVMGITIFHINRAFDSISTERLTALKD